jgi:hypothetical protein
LLREGVAELTVGVGRLETSVADLHVQLAAHSMRFDRINARRRAWGTLVGARP